ncbi:MAG: LytTR family DNA-binding domain-containing protein [Terrimicrobiaceae bacterium]|nr:LytTR family DNA-binding domain-containing protein [Terrimicrobiaceae bacterium]
MIRPKIAKSKQRSKLKLLVVDKERETLKDLRRLLQKVSFPIETVTARTAPEAIGILAGSRFDGVLIDIALPESGCADFYQKLGNQAPPVVFTSDHGEHALQAFEVGAVDYVLKPMDVDRLELAISRICSTKKANHAAPAEHPIEVRSDGRILIPQDDNLWLIAPHEIIYLEAVGNYSSVVFGNRKVLVRRTLKNLEQTLRGHGFFRASRDRIINLKYVESYAVTGRHTLRVHIRDGKEFEMSRRRACDFRRQYEI